MRSQLIKFLAGIVSVVPHALNAEARRDRIEFLVEQLKLKPVPANVIASVPELFQPARQD